MDKFKYTIQMETKKYLNVQIVDSNQDGDTIRTNTANCRDNCEFELKGWSLKWNEV